MPSLLRRTDPFPRYNFYIEWDGLIHAGFSECSGLDSVQDPIEYREGTDPLTARKLPGLTRYANITLKRGITHNDELWQWRSEIMQGRAWRREISIVLLDNTGQETVRWNLTHCWPSAWTGPELSAVDEGVAIETLELAHEGIVKYAVRL